MEEMKNKKAEAVIKRLQDANKTERIKILGDEQNREYAFSIFMQSQNVISYVKDEYIVITENTINLLKEAEIKFKIIE